MKTKYKTPKFGDTEGIWIRWTDGQFHPFTIKCFDRILHRIGLQKIGTNRWTILEQ